MATLLIVDDHMALAMGVKAILSAAGHEVEVVSRASQSIKLAQDRFFDVALVDMIFTKEDLSGIDVLESISINSPTTKLVLFTAGGDDRRHHIATALHRFPVAGGIPKDATDADIFRCVDAVLAGSTYFHQEIEIYRPPGDRNPTEELLRVPSHAAIWVALASGHTTIEGIAAATNYSANTVRKATGPMGEKLRDLGLTNRTQTNIADLAAYAAEHRAFFLNWSWRQGRQRT